jgi:Zn-dependent peptidase ImmA (M78 family)
MSDRGKRSIVSKHVQQAPVDVERLAHDLGLPVEKKPFTGNIAGQIKRDIDAEGGYKIFVNSDEHSHRRRFTIAHEIAHFLLHPNFIGDEVTDENYGDGMYRSKLSNALEIEANKLASDLIMPVKLVRAFRQQNPQSDWREVADHFDVSPEAAKIRLQQIKWGKARDLS